ncbi:MAG TPA: cupin domain-containing protein [Opitutaceae bacterium]|nr:cupin domain-containing protein [Opitutaceae bacterium]
MPIECERLVLKPRGWVPNNGQHPLLIYRRAVDPAGPGDLAARLEELFRRNGWPPQWRDGVYPFHHYHSTAHEVLGFAAGTARLVFGGEGGHETAVHPGDVAVLPAGTGHCRLSASQDFLVIGGYPAGQEWDTCRSPAEAATLARIRAVPYPASDPVLGSD